MIIECFIKCTTLLSVILDNDDVDDDNNDDEYDEHGDHDHDCDDSGRWCGRR